MLKPLVFGNVTTGLRISDNIASTGVTYAEVETLVEGGVAGRYLKTGI